MPFVFKDVDTLDRDPPPPKVGNGDCVDLVKHYVPGLEASNLCQTDSDSAASPAIQY